MLWPGRLKNLAAVFLSGALIALGPLALPAPNPAAVASAVPLASGPASGASQGTTAQVLTRVPVTEKVVALTFDAGSDDGHTRAILDILQDEGVRATFFLTGEWLSRFPDSGKAIVDRGHEVGHHSYDHPHLTKLTGDEIRGQLSRTEEQATRALGRSLKPLFRPPFGEYDARVLEVVGDSGYDRIVMWTVDSLDWKMIPAQELTDRVVSGVVPGAIVLMHVGAQTNTPEALPGIIKQLRNKGYGFATVSDLLDLAAKEGARFHTVARGDTLTSIARRYGVDVDAVLKVNSLKDANALGVGMVLVIPGPGADNGGAGGDVNGGAGSDNQGGTGRSGQERGRGFVGRALSGLAQWWHSFVGAAKRLLAWVFGD